MLQKKLLNDVTLVAISSVKHGETLNALSRSLTQIQPHKTIFFSDINMRVSKDIEVVKIDNLSWHGYSHFILKELYKHITTAYVLIQQWDSWVLDASQWNDEFFDYDYIGALWLYQDGRANGNGGFSLRSELMLQATALDEFIDITHPEDEVVGRLYRSYLEGTHGIRFAPDYICEQFSFELREPTRKTFGFHSFHHRPYKEHVVIRRTAAMGDVIMAEPIMAHYNDLGHQVVLDTLPQFMDLFFMHHYPIKHISEVSPNVKPVAYIDLDMAYEESPKELVLKAYAKKAGIENMNFRNPKLKYGISEQNKLFLKYVVIHIDDTAMPHRNIRGVDWDFVRRNLESRGYTVLQVGKANHAIAGTYINTHDLKMLMYVVAGADLVIANDSGVGQMAVALNRKTVMFFGSVLPIYRYYDMTNMAIVQNYCDKAGCYHEQVSVSGKDCFYNKETPPCTQFTTTQVFNALNQLI
jgi:hypothetical protein